MNNVDKAFSALKHFVLHLILAALVLDVGLAIILGGGSFFGLHWILSLFNFHASLANVGVGAAAAIIGGWVFVYAAKYCLYVSLAWAAVKTLHHWYVLGEQKAKTLLHKQ